jgi:two-component system cell cycle response regulator
MGVNDYLMRSINRNEMLVRVRAQIKRKRYSDQLRNRLEESVEMALMDSLTDLYNRPYMEGHLSTLVEESVQRGKPLSMLITDIDYFKAVNDTHGQDAGDQVLQEFSLRLRSSIRGIDLACRFGDEEFVVIMPDTDMTKAYLVAERLRQTIAGKPFLLTEGTQLETTASIGVACLEGVSDTSEALLKRADQSLHCAKRDGRNRVVADAA